ncbi:GNAT family N-acetyltransferase [Shewanella sp. UCD-KL21]|uniref:GNAT family N-acetyltransferase n=1 Tax=Shewanella sp. UCD-KL21 TaxID=1917164 RepID=UPI000970B6A5|nr:GNAT family N-acetyltransferase [Shewanella sp. UCD-KL21]
MQIRKAQRHDAKVAFEIRNQAILSQCKGHYDDAMLAAWTAGELPIAFTDAFSEHGYVAMVNDAVVGVGMIDVNHDAVDSPIVTTGMVDAMFVRPTAFGQGVGRAMLQQLEAVAIKAGCKKLILDASLNAADFYRACGFKGDKQSIYHSPRGLELACIPMEKIISN